MTVFHFCFDLNLHGWIRQEFLRDPAQYLDANRNAVMNANAAR